MLTVQSLCSLKNCVVNHCLLLKPHIIFAFVPCAFDLVLTKTSTVWSRFLVRWSCVCQILSVLTLQLRWKMAMNLKLCFGVKTLHICSWSHKNNIFLQALLCLFHTGRVTSSFPVKSMHDAWIFTSQLRFIAFETHQVCRSLGTSTSCTTRKRKRIFETCWSEKATDDEQEHGVVGSTHGFQSKMATHPCHQKEKKASPTAATDQAINKKISQYWRSNDFTWERINSYCACGARRWVLLFLLGVPMGTWLPW